MDLPTSPPKTTPAAPQGDGLEEYTGSYFHWADYAVFAASLALSCGIGVFYAIRDRNSASADEYLMGGRKMAVLPVALSIFVSWLSAISFLGDPVEVYNYGVIYWWLGLGYAIVFPLVAHVFVPKFHRAQITSAYEYLGLKFHGSLRLLGSIVNGVLTIGYLGIVLYAPSLALSLVTGFDIWIIIIIIGAVTTLYTTLGGIKAVLWADTLQAMVVFAGMIMILIQTTVKVGGFGRAWQIAEERGRLNYFKFTAHPFERSNVWWYIFGGFVQVFSPFICNQYFVQRYNTLRSTRSAITAMYLQIPLFVITVGLLGLIGLVMFAYFHACDPVKAGRIDKPDQMIPLLMLEVFQEMPGIPGLFLAAMCSASLSTLSSGENALAATFLKDIAEPLFKTCTKRELSDRAGTWLAKFFSLFLGCVVIGLAFLILLSNNTIFGLAIQFTGMFGGPLCGIFLLAMLFPWVGTVAAWVGFVTGAAVSLWWGIGSVVTQVSFPKLPTSVSQCDVMIHNDTMVTNLTNPYFVQPLAPYTDLTNLAAPAGNGGSAGYHSGDQFGVSDLYWLSPILYTPLGCILVVLVGLIIGSIRALCLRCCCTAQRRKEEEEKAWMSMKLQHQFSNDSYHSAYYSVGERSTVGTIGDRSTIGTMGDRSTLGTVGDRTSMRSGTVGDRTSMRSGTVGDRTSVLSGRSSTAGDRTSSRSSKHYYR